MISDELVAEIGDSRRAAVSMSHLRDTTGQGLVTEERVERVPCTAEHAGNTVGPPAATFGNSMPPPSSRSSALKSPIVELSSSLDRRGSHLVTGRRCQRRRQGRDGPIAETVSPGRAIEPALLATLPPGRRRGLPNSNTGSGPGLSQTVVHTVAARNRVAHSYAQGAP